MESRRLLTPYVNRVQVFTLLMPFAFYYCLLEKTIHYFMLIQGSPTNGTFEWSSPRCWTYWSGSEQDSDGSDIGVPILLRVDWMWWRLEWQGANDPSWILHTRWNHSHPQNYDSHYMLNIPHGFLLWLYLDSFPTYHPFHQYHGYPRVHRVRRSNDHSTRIVLWIERDWYHSKSSSDPSVFVPRPIRRFEDCEP